MTKYKILYKTFITIILITSITIVYAKNKSITTSKHLNIEQLIQCQETVEKLNWSYHLWPKENNGNKPSLNEVITENDIINKISSRYSMEVALKKIFNVEFNEILLQQELNRIVNNSKNQKRLERYFEALNHDPNLIASCLIKPYYVKNMLYDKYSWSEKFNKGIRKEIKSIFENGQFNKSKLIGSSVLINTTIFQLDNSKASNSLHKLDVFTINKNEFEAKLQAIEKHSGNTVKETATSFVYEEIIQKTEKNLTIKAYKWSKTPFTLWWKSVEETYKMNENLLIYNQLNLNLPDFKADDIKSVTIDSWSSNNIVLKEKTLFSSIWTGTEMIVWGGFDGNFDATKSGYKYNPSLDTWQPVSETGAAPDARYRHTAVWTGVKMIVWGGRNSSNQSINTGAAYNPLTDNWVSISSNNNPSPRVEHTAIWTGSEMLIWGGSAFFNQITNTGGRYDISSNTWSSIETNNAPSGRRRHTAVFTGTQMLVWGGLNSAGNENTGGIYDLSNDSWDTIDASSPNTPVARSLHSAVWDYANQQMIIWGSSLFQANGGLYDPLTDQWTAMDTSGAPMGRDSATTVFTGTHMLVWGGNNGNNLGVTDGGQFNPLTNSWSGISPTNEPDARFNQSGIWSGDELIVWGGGTLSSIYNTGGKYDPQLDIWVPMGETVNLRNAATPRFSHTSTWDGSVMMVWGGTDFSGPLNTGGRYYPFLNVWETVNSLTAPSARFNHTAIRGSLGTIIWGGQDNVQSFNTGARYIPFFDSWTPTASQNSPQARFNHSAIWTGTQMLVWGGQDSFGYFNNGSVYENSTWSPMSTTTFPDRGKHTSVWTGNEMLIWGGYQGGTFFNDGISYDPASNLWTLFDVSDAPSPRSSHSTIWSGTEMIVWGGTNGINDFNSGGRFDFIGDSWVDTLVDGSEPIVRSGHSAVWAGSEMIVWGGFTLGTGFHNTGGIYNPVANNWLDMTTTDAPSARTGHTAHWIGDKMLVWGGGVDAGSTVYDYSFETQYTVGGNVFGLVGTIVLKNNGINPITLAADGPFTFPSQTDATTYTITTSASQTQTCTVNNGAGTIAGADVTDVFIDCVINDPVAIDDQNVTVLEDSGANTIDVLSNDTSYGQISIASITQPGGGLVIITNNGANLSYQPQQDVCGFVDTFTYTLNGGSSATVSVNILCVNDQPIFTGLDVVHIPVDLLPNGISCGIIVGPMNEFSQTFDFNVTIASDPNNIMTSFDILNNGQLNYILTGNLGDAIIEFTVQDSGGTANGGVDTSIVYNLTVHVYDYIFKNEFEGDFCQSLNN